MSEITEFMIEAAKMEKQCSETTPPHIRRYIMSEIKTEKERKEAMRYIGILKNRGGMTMYKWIAEQIVKPLHMKLYSEIRRLQREDERFKDKSEKEILEWYIGSEEAEKAVIQSAKEIVAKFPRGFRFYKKHIEDALEPATILKMIMQTEHDLYLAIIKKKGGFEWFCGLIERVRESIGLQPFEKSLNEIKESVNEFIEEKKKEAEKFEKRKI